MGPSWQDVIRQLQWNPAASPFDARLAIEAGAFYQAQLRSKWKPAGRSAFDRNDLGAAAYNTGLGNVIKAQRACGDAVLWADISPCMTNITGPKNAKETLGYVTNIRKWFKMMEAQ